MPEMSGTRLKLVAVTIAVAVIALVGWLTFDVRVATPACHLVSDPDYPCGGGEPTAAPTPLALTQGNVNCKPGVDSVDALNVQQHVAGLRVSQQPGCPAIGSEVASLFGDVDCDNDIDAVDALKILRFVVVLPVTQTEPCPDIGSPL